jgi:precorrin-6A/cobalt-precorrin-6A reductase
VRQILILGGTTEAYQLASLAAQIPDCRITTALAGRTQAPRIPSGDLTMGGFGGIEGLVHYLQTHEITELVDATHPFATQISNHAAIAAAHVHIPYLRLVRPAWDPVPGDRWVDVANLEAAATLVPQMGQRVFLSIGRQDLSHFINVKHVWFLMRRVDPPDPSHVYPEGVQLVQRGPFTLSNERSLLQHYGIEAVVSKNSGGDATYAKIAAARELGLPVIMVQRPPLEVHSSVTSVEAALAWLQRGS